MKKYNFLDIDLIKDFQNSTTNNYVSKIANEVASQTEKAILSQLNDYISRGLIELEISEPVLVQDANNSGVEYRRTVFLKLKDREYVEKLEKKVELLENLIKQLKELK